MERNEIIKFLIDKHITIGSAESLTGGLFASSVVNYPGVSAIYKGSIVSYSDEIKNRLLHVKKSDIKKFSPVSSVVALEMAKNGQKILNVDFCLSFTGFAGGGEHQNRDGEVFIALAFFNDAILEHYRFTGDRTKIRQQAVDEAFNLLSRVIKSCQ